MNRWAQRQWVAGSVKAMVLALSCVGLVSADGGRHGDRDKPIPLTVPKAKCGPHDRPETALQGQVPAAMRAAGFQGFNCNLELVGQFRGNGANWQTTQFQQRLQGRHGGRNDDDDDDDDRGHGKSKRTRICGYHGTASPALSRPGRTAMGVPALDLSDPRNPIATAYLTTPAMLDPWESLKVNERRQLLTADNGQNGGGGPEIDVYDLSDDCRYPQLLASAPVGTGLDGGIKPPATPIGHEGSISPDGLTYYIGDTRNRAYHAVDLSDPSKPKMIATFSMPSIGLRTHGLSISQDGNRAYVVSTGSVALADLGNPNAATSNGFVIMDTSEIRARKPNAQFRPITTYLIRDGSIAQHTIPVKIRGKSYLIHIDEGGSGGISGAAQFQAACAAGMTPFPMARILDLGDETKPVEVSKLMLEVHDPKNCAAVAPDIVGLSIFTYGSHYCSVDNKKNATTLACGYFNSGIRVFDIRDPRRPKEVAYFNPAGVLTDSPGSNHNLGNNFRPGAADWCSAQVHLDAKKGTLWTTCQDNGVLVLKFRKSVWPFENSRTPAGEQN
jgi:hypothetical protein